MTITDSTGQTAVKTLDVLVKAPDPTPTPAPTATPTPEPDALTPAATPAPAPIKQPSAGAAPTAVTLEVRAAKGRKLTLTGALQVPAGASCPLGGAVRLTIALPGADRRATARLKAGCAYSVKATLPRRAAGHEATVRARFQALAPSAS